MSEKPEFPRDVVRDVLLQLWRCFDPEPANCDLARHCPNARCERLCAVGGYRRGKAAMKDIELLYIPRVSLEADPGDMFGAQRESHVTEQLIERLVREGVLDRRAKVDGSVSAWGPWNKHARHVATGLPVDLFAATRESYFNRLVVTTGPRELNVRIANAALARGWEWEVGEAGFVPRGMTWAAATAERRTMRSEAEVFAFVGMEFLPPEARC